MSDSIHSLLKRQLKQYFGAGKPPDEFMHFFAAVNKAYFDFDADRNMIERSLEFSSQELMQANSDMQAIFRAFPDIFFRIDYAGNILEYRWGGKRDSIFAFTGLVGKQIQDIAGSAVRENFIESIELVRIHQVIANMEYAMSLEGLQRFFEARFIPLNEKEIIVIVRDISDRKKIENELKDTNETLKQNERALRDMLVDLKKAHEDLTSAQSQLLQSEKLASIGQLAAGVAHEINNPIGFISNNMEMLQQYVGHYSKVLRMVQILKESVEQENISKAKSLVQEISRFEQEVDMDYVFNDMDKLLQNTQRGLERVRKIVLDLRIFSREDNESMESVKIEEVIDSILSIVHSEIKYKADLKKDYGDTPLVKCSAQKLGQVFINLFVNAAQAMDERGSIEVRTYRQDKYVMIDVHDTGKGIPPENLKKIFDPFFTTKPVGQGTGLGLSVSYEIIKKHGGELRVRSKEGEGTTFTILLPVNG